MLHTSSRSTPHSAIDLSSAESAHSPPQADRSEYRPSIALFDPGAQPKWGRRLSYICHDSLFQARFSVMSTEIKNQLTHTSFHKTEDSIIRVSYNRIINTYTYIWMSLIFRGYSSLNTLSFPRVNIFKDIFTNNVTRGMPLWTVYG